MIVVNNNNNNVLVLMVLMASVGNNSIGVGGSSLVSVGQVVENKRQWMNERIIHYR